jgi:hypothetical protein
VPVADEDVRDSSTLVVLREGLILVGWFGVFGYDVPCVKETGNLESQCELGLLINTTCREEFYLELTKPRMQRSILMRESAEQMPHLTQTMRELLANHYFLQMELIVRINAVRYRTRERRKENRQEAKEDVGRAHIECVVVNDSRVSYRANPLVSSYLIGGLRESACLVAGVGDFGDK